MSAWEQRPEGLCRTFVFADFIAAFAFMTRVALVAERMGHHPMWTNTYNSVSIVLNTHDAGGRITEKDHRLAEAIDKVV
ncbi:MAG: 4a-hydroxytetrahydrobiopterin dehydratase [Flavobacteriales bacterium]